MTDSGPMTAPTRAPARAWLLENDCTVMVRSAIPGSYAIATCGASNVTSA